MSNGVFQAHVWPRGTDPDGVVALQSSPHTPPRRARHWGEGFPGAGMQIGGSGTRAACVEAAPTSALRRGPAAPAPGTPAEGSAAGSDTGS